MNQVASTPSHISSATTPYLRSYGSWLNQAEILLKSFGVRYFQHGNWTRRQHLIDHLRASTPEYNRLRAYPINWSWTRHVLHKWAEKKLS